MLPAMKHVGGDTFVFQQDNTPSYRAKGIIKLLQQETPDLIHWPPNSPDMNPVDYKVWGVARQRVCECRMNSVDELKQRVAEVWNSLDNDVLCASSVQAFKRRLSLHNFTKFLYVL